VLIDSDTAVLVPPDELLNRFDRPGPRYTSYPTADRFVESFDAGEHAAQLARRREALRPTPLSLYVHLPFCNTICYYCACNKVVTRDRSRASEYLTHLRVEAELVGEALGGVAPVEQLHLGGGTPTYFSEPELEQLMELLARHFPAAPAAECSVEIDPRSTPPTKVRTLAALGFSRMSLGVQDFDAGVQRAVNRIQPFEMTAATVEAARGAGVRSINLDLIYGLPGQTRASFDRTLDAVLRLLPERIALYHYAHLPARFKPQRRIDETRLPSAAEKMAIMRAAIGRLTEAGYQYVGMDHFARADDDLARAQRHGRLHRNFQGYSTRPDCDLVGLGVSAISRIGASYAQNARELPDYVDRLSAGQLPVARGVLLDADDLLRRAVIMSLMCNLMVSREAIESAFLVDFGEYFQRELDLLREHEDAGLVEVSPEWVNVTARGRLLVRAIAMIFDRYLSHDQRLQRYSKIV
jgi:oxygen-independent coproporphyrinogen III oxidase